MSCETKLTWHNAAQGDAVWALWRGEWMAATISAVGISKQKVEVQFLVRPCGKRSNLARVCYADLRVRKNKDKPARIIVETGA